MSIKQFYIFGLQRTGTTFVEHILSKNFDCSVSNSGRPYWKHTHEVPDITDRPAYLTTKNPYQWIESICFREHADLPPTALNRYGYDVHEGPENTANTFNVRVLAKMYNDYYKKWIFNSSAQRVKYEPLLTKEGLDQFINSIGFPRITRKVIVPAPGSLFMSEGYSNQMVDYYLEGKATQLDQQQLDIINQQLDDKLLDAMGYGRQ